MRSLIRKKIILNLLDSHPKSANEIADEIGESLPTVEEQLETLVSENICENVNDGAVNQYVVRKDIEAFAQLVETFLSDKVEHKEEIEKFITSKYYFARIDCELVDYVLKRFYLDSAYQTPEDKLGIRRILLASPSALLFALYEDTTRFSRMRSSSDQLDSSDETRGMLTGILNSEFLTPLLENLIADMKIPCYRILYAKLGVQVVVVRTEVKLATGQGKYVEAIGGGNYSLFKAAEDLQAGQLTSAVDPMVFCSDGIAFMHLGEFRTALENFDKAFGAVPDPIQKALVLNAKGWAFLNRKQYQKAIECFEEGIAFDSEGEISLLRENKQVAEEYLTQATDADNLAEPTQIRFVQGQPIPFEETLFYEFKEIRGRNPTDSITNTADEYAVAFLNSKGGRVFWGIKDSDRITIGVTFDERQRNEVRRKVSEKLGSIDPPISIENWHLEFHNVYDFQQKVIENLWVVELRVLPRQGKDIFYTNSGELFVKTDGGKRKLLKSQVTEFIQGRLQDNTETD